MRAATVTSPVNLLSHSSENFALDLFGEALDLLPHERVISRTKPSAPTLSAEPEAASEQTSYQGYSNSMTWSVALELENSAFHHENITKLIAIDGTLDPMRIKQYVETLPKSKAVCAEEWATGNVNWDEIASDFTSDIDGIGNDEMRHISKAQIDGNIVRLINQLDRATYERVNKILTGLGGKWNRSKKGHVFDVDPSELIEQFLLTGKLSNAKKDFGYFPTPDAVVNSLMQLADIQPGMSVLEPSAGDGQLARAAAGVVGHELVFCCECQKVLAAKLHAQSFNVIHEGDFLELQPEPRFQRVLMNPPFGKQADIRHVMQADKWLVPGGRLVAVMSMAVTFRDNKLTSNFREFLKERQGEIIELPERAFRASGTDVRTVMVVFDKPIL